MRVAKFFVPIVLVAFMMMACASFNVNTYRALNTAGVVYDEAMKGLADLYFQGKITTEQKDQAVKLATAYHGAYHGAVDAFDTYMKVQDQAGLERLKTLLAVLQTKLDAFLAYLKEIAPIFGQHIESMM